MILTVDTQPLRFSVILPVYDRVGMIRRAIDSCLAQQGADFEVIVVDDGSTDGTPAVVAAYTDPRVRLIRHPRNLGVCAARNTAIDQATGDWCVLLDSDFEFLPGALAGLAELCGDAPADVGAIATMCTWDRGGDTPIPAPADDLTLDYPSYLQFISGLVVSEWFNCIRRTVFDEVRFPSRRAYEAGFHLGLARRFRFQFYRRRSVRIHTDALNRVTIAQPAYAARRMRQDAEDCAADVEGILAEHGEALRTYAPMLHVRYIEALVQHHLLAGHRVAALDALRPIAAGVLRSPTLIAMVGLGLLGPMPLAWVKAEWTWLRRNRETPRTPRTTGGT